MCTGTSGHSIGAVNCPSVSGPGGAAPPATAVFMSVVISDALSVRRYTRTSSMRPPKYSPQMALPPRRSGFVDVAMDPVTAIELARAPFTYSRRFAPS